MRTRIHVIPRLIVATCLCMAMMPWALAFYPIGFFDPETGGQLVFVRWPLSVLDANNDGDVSGDSDGVEFNFEVGNEIPTDGFSEVEAGEVLSGLEEWELVSTAFMAFRRGQDIIEEVELTNELTSIDAFNVVVLQTAGEIADGQPDVTGGSLGVTLYAFSFEDTFITIGNTTVPIDKAEFLDVDIAMSEGIRLFEQEVQVSGLFRTAGVHLGGHALGLNYSPLTNYDDDASEQLGFGVEPRVVAIRNFDGTIGTRGVTSSMVNDVYFHEDGADLVIAGNDLAPDDIAGLTTLYPRDDLDLFFEIDQRARTQARDGLASAPLNGAWIRAWADADNLVGTPRVPMFDTLTGLYEELLSPNFVGHFELKGLFKQLETSNEASFFANYVITCSEFLPVIFPDDERVIYDSTHSASAIGISFDSLFPSEVFNEDGNRFGLANINQGTPLVFDLLSRKVVSQTSGKSLDTILAVGRPMFGDQDKTCPLNVIVTPIDDGGEAITSLRAMRDNVLLKSAFGTAIADTYYRLAPGVAEFFKNNATALSLAQSGFKSGAWIFRHAEILLLLTGCGLAALVSRARMRRVAVAAAVLAVCASFFTAQAQLLPYTLQDYVLMSDAVVVGTVTSTESRWVKNNTNIVTNIAIEVHESIKGDQNTGALVHIQQPTGRVGAIVRGSQQLPEFEVGEELLLFLKEDSTGFQVYGGVAGKYRVVKHPRTGEKYVFATSLPGHTRLEHEIAKMRNEKESEIEPEIRETKFEYMKPNFEKRSLVTLKDFSAHLRKVARDQERRTFTAKKLD